MAIKKRPVSPRQKMINLMYVVLMAMLAMNVSTEVLEGFSLVEVVSSCPTNWGLSPEKALQWLEENMIPYYPLGVKKDKGAE